MKFEGPSMYDQEPNDSFDQEPDLAELIERKKQERLEKEAREKEEKETKEKAKSKNKKRSKKAKDIAKKGEKLADDSAELKQKAGEAKEVAKELQQDIKELAKDNAEIELPAPLEITFTEGSEYTATLQEGEDTVLELQHHAEVAEKTADLADEVSERAQAIARARQAIETVTADEIGHVGARDEAITEVYGGEDPSEDVYARLKTAWDNPETSSDTAASYDTPAETAPLGYSTDPEQSSFGTTHISPDFTKAPNVNQPAEPESKKSNILASGAAFASGLFIGKASQLKDQLARSNEAIAAETATLAQEVQSIQQTAEMPQPVHYETPQHAETKPERPDISPSTPKSYESAIPSWVRQIESDVKKGKVVELKKWQRDVLKAQYPKLLASYDALDLKHTKELKTQTESAGNRTIFSAPLAAQPASNDALPAPAYAMPAYMQQAPSNAPMAAPQPVYTTPGPEYAYQASSTVSSAYLTIVAIGGVLFGAALIVAFGF